MTSHLADVLRSIRYAVQRLLKDSEQVTKVITIDGPSYCGKGHIANALSWTRFKYFDSGLLFRKLAHDFASLERPYSADALIKSAYKLEGDLCANIRRLDTLNQPELRLHAVSIIATKIAGEIRVQEIMQRILRHYVRAWAAAGLGTILDGRNTGSAVWPDAQIKIFVYAAPEVRIVCAKRFLYFKGRGDYSLADLDQTIRERDSADQNRKIAPMTEPPDAYRIDLTEVIAEGNAIDNYEVWSGTNKPACVRKVEELLEILRNP